MGVYAARQGSSGSLTVLVLNKDPIHDLKSSISLKHFTPTGPIRVYRYSNANPNAIVRGPNLSSGTTLNLVFPSYSITLLVAR